MVDKCNRDISTNTKNNFLRREIQKDLQSIKNKFLKNAKEVNSTPPILIQGDLQDTVSKTTKDNVSTGRAKTPHPLGILAWYNKVENKTQEFTFFVYENTLDDEAE